MTERITIKPYGFSGQSRVGPRNGVVPFNGDTVNVDTHRALGESWGSRGFQIHRFVKANASKPAGSWLHTHTDGGSTPVYLGGAELYPETGSDTPTAIASALDLTFKPIFVSAAPDNGMSVFFNGVNGQAQLIREDGADALEAVLLNFDAPADYTAGVTTPPNGTALNGTYHVAVVYEDSGGAVLVQTAPTFVKDIAVASGDSIDIDISSLSHPTRATHWSVYVSSTTDAGDSYLQEIDSQVIANETVSITALTGTTTLTHINNFYRTASLPLTAIDSAWLREGRLWVASSISNKVYFSERNNPNHWYSINEVTAGAETGFSDGVVGGIESEGSSYLFTRSAIHRVFGDLTRDDQFVLRIGQSSVATNFGLVGPNALARQGNMVYFYSDQGLAVLQGGATGLVSPDDEQGVLDRLDTTYLDRVTLAVDPLGYVCILAPRLTNSSRPLDGASTAGIADRIYRWDYRHRVWAPPLALGDLVHLSARQNPAAGGTSTKVVLMASSPNGYVLETNKGWSGGGALDVSGTEYDGQLTTSVTTLTATYVEAGVSNDDYNGMTVELFYPTGDTVYPGLRVTRTITDTVVSGSNVTIHWLGALTVPSASGNWTVRVAGLGGVSDIAMRLDIPAGFKARLMGVRAKYHHMVGEESVS